jgi:hypothetical protein
VPEFLHANSNVKAILEIHHRAQERLGHIEEDDRAGVGRCRHRTKTTDEIARRLSHRHQNGSRLKRHRRQQADRKQEVNEEQDLPERINSYIVEYYVHGVSSTSLGLWRR